MTMGIGPTHGKKLKLFFLKPSMLGLLYESYVKYGVCSSHTQSDQPSAEIPEKKSYCILVFAQISAFQKLRFNIGFNVGVINYCFLTYIVLLRSCT